MLETINIKLFEPTKEERLINILKSFNISIRTIEIIESKFFDIFNIKLCSGVKSSKVDKVLTEIGLEFESQSTPRGYPVMKEGVYRIEIQHSKIECPDLTEFLDEAEGMFAPIVMGTDSFGNKVVKDLNKMPNLLVGGTTGSGKSVVLHNFILSLIHSGADIYLVDPKMVEFSAYEDVKEVKSIVSFFEDFENTIEYLKSLMQIRFKLLKTSRSRNVHEFNAKANKESDKLKPIVLVIDEWADIVLQNPKIQKPLCYLAQKGRAAGISIILATQRPSANVVSGLIKANFPGRLALKVASSIDSRVILDSTGAEGINDPGVGLYLDGSISEPIMFKSPYIEDLEGKMVELEIETQEEGEWDKIQKLW
jgi:S-DNA-T family DNA segregation ATPase FtsK/SpoIIIE